MKCCYCWVNEAKFKRYFDDVSDVPDPICDECKELSDDPEARDVRIE